jgi:hypothetical protein
MAVIALICFQRPEPRLPGSSRVGQDDVDEWPLSDPKTTPFPTPTSCRMGMAQARIDRIAG